METQEVACNLCGSTDSGIVYSDDDSQEEGQVSFALRRCQRCGLMYLSPRPTPEAMTAYYYPEDYASYRPAIEDERCAVMRWVRRRKLITRRRIVERYSEQVPGRILDVGCATGLFLHEMARTGWRAVGVEPVASAAEYARSRLGLNVFLGMLKEADYAAGSFDVVTFWDVLEHTFSPVDQLARAAHLLCEGGVLIANVPNWNSPDRHLFGRYWLGVDLPRHLYVFTRDTLNALLTRTGFSVVDRICFVSGYFSSAASLGRWLETKSPTLARAVSRLLGLPGMRFLFEPWFLINNWLGRGATVSVIARKTGSTARPASEARQSA